MYFYDVFSCLWKFDKLNPVFCNFLKNSQWDIYAVIIHYIIGILICDGFCFQVQIVRHFTTLLTLTILLAIVSLNLWIWMYTTHVFKWKSIKLFFFLFLNEFTARIFLLNGYIWPVQNALCIGSSTSTERNRRIKRILGSRYCRTHGVDQVSNV